mmetsp:Transcript_3663/g.11616  ORF Transcript_3663/g.11616 Transcript_3663/m.11616 type:complete len:222 (-) Transcript_3663:432-1097(-)
MFIYSHPNAKFCLYPRSTVDRALLQNAPRIFRTFRSRCQVQVQVRILSLSRAAKKLHLSGGPVTLRSGEAATVIRNDMLVSVVVNLRQDSADTQGTGRVRCDDELLVVTRCSQHWRRRDEFDEAADRCLALRRLRDGSHVDARTSKVGERGRDVREALDEPTVVRTKAEKRANLFERIDVTRIDRAYRLDFLGVHLETTTRDDVPEVLALDSEQHALGGLT